jgi:hypothetical protein
LFPITTLVNALEARNASRPILVTLSGITTLVTEVFGTAKIEFPLPTFRTGSPPKTLGIVTAPVAVEAVIVAPPFSTM